MRFFLRKQIHSGFSSASSSDVYLIKELCSPIPENSLEKLENEKYGLTILYDDSDETFYKKALNQRSLKNDFSRTPEFENLIQKYESQGWERENKNSWVRQTLRNIYEENLEEEKRKREKEGYVIPMWASNMEPGSYKGGFSEEVFRNSHLQDYLSKGGCFGWIGHLVRKPQLDAYLENKFMRLESEEDKINLFSVWLTSTDGRHFADSLSDEDFKRQKEIIDKRINEIYNLAFIYSREEHEGTLKSTLQLKKRYEDKLKGDNNEG